MGDEYDLYEDSFLAEIEFNMFDLDVIWEIINFHPKMGFPLNVHIHTSIYLGVWKVHDVERS